MAGQIWAVDSLGGYSYSDNLSEVLRQAVQPLTKFRQFADAKDGNFKGAKNRGEAFHWDVYSDVATQGGTLVETSTMPETNFTITQGTLTICEAGNSVPYTGKLDNLSAHPIKEIIKKALKNDAKKAFDILAHAQFDATPLRVYPLTASTIHLATTGTVGGSAGFALAKAHVKLIVETMKERNIPSYSGDDYYAISWPTTFHTFSGELETLHTYTERGLGMIMNGEMGRYNNCRFIEQTNIAKAGTTTTDWVFFFGEDTVAEAICIPEEMRGGRSCPAVQ